MNEPTTPPDQASSPEREIPTTGSPASTAASASTTGSAPATGFPDSGAAVPASAAGSPGSAAGSPGSAAAYEPAGRAAAAERSLAARAMVARLHQLAAALTARGLTVSVGQDSLLARNPAASDTDDPRGRVLNPGLSQTVAVTARDDGTLHFHWCWSGATRGAPMELEYMTPAHDIDGAARRIARVLAVTGE